MPKAMHIEIKDDPPYEINGRVTPVVGIIFIDTLIFIKDCKINKTNNPEQATNSKRF